MTVIAMSRAEIDRMTILRDLAEDRIKVSEAATLMGLGRRQLFRLAKAFRQHGPAALVSWRRGKPHHLSHCFQVFFRRFTVASWQLETEHIAKTTLQPV